MLFLHVPSDASEQALKLGLDLTVELIRSVLESELIRKRRREKEDGAGGDGKEGELK